MSLRGRLFAAMLAALALTLALTIAIGAVLTRRQVDRSQAAALARQADDLAAATAAASQLRRSRADARGSVLVWIARRPAFERLVPNVNRFEQRKDRLPGQASSSTRYRTIPHLGLLMLRPASMRSAAWRPFLVDLLLAALAGVGARGRCSRSRGPLDHAADQARRRSDARARRGGDARAAADRGLERARRARRGVQPDGRGAGRLARRPSGLPALGQPRAEDAADRDSWLRRGARRGSVRAGRGRADDPARGGPARAARPRPARPGPHEPQRVLGPRRAGRPGRDRARGGRRATRSAARSFGVELAAGRGESWVEADADRVLQVASNLVENALRETPAGGAVHRVRPRRAGSSSPTPARAFPPEDLPHAFERFYLYDKFGQRRPVGSGLGLAIVQQLVTGDGRRGRASRATRGGTRFTVSLRPELRGVDDLEVGAGQTAERV